MPTAKAPGVFLVVCFLAGSVLPGCSRSVQAVPGHDNLQALSVFYGQFVGQHRGKPPANLDEFKTWVKKLDKAQFDRFQIDANNLDALFVSPRDHQPFAFVFSATAMAPGPEGKGGLVIYEQAGVGGLHMVVYSTGRIEEVDEATLHKQIPGK